MKLAPILIRARASDDFAFESQTDAFVDHRGEFSVVIPEELVEIAETKMPMSGLGIHGSRGKSRVHCTNLREAEKFLNDCANDFVTVETVKDRVILYGCRLQVSFWINKDGTLLPNGGMNAADRDGHWWQPKTDKYSNLHSRNCVEFYSVGLGAIVFDKVTHKRASGDTLEWQRVREDHDSDDDTPLGRLNGFSTLAFDPEEHPGTFKEMPYSDKAAEFFYNILIALCQIGKNIDDFFADKKRLQLAIDNKLALPFSSK